jgi:hypothetical protein
MSQISSELKNAIITIGTHRVMWRVREEERRRRELLGEEMAQSNLINQSIPPNEIVNPSPRYPDRPIEDLFPYDRSVITPTPANIIAPDTTTRDERRENDKTPTRENQGVTSTAEFLNSFRQTLIATVHEGKIKQARRRSQETSEASLSPTTSSIIAIPEETPTEALLRTNLAGNSEEETRATYLQNMQTTMGRLQFNRSTQSIVDTDLTNEFDIVDRHKAKRRRLND